MIVEGESKFYFGDYEIDVFQTKRFFIPMLSVQIARKDIDEDGACYSCQAESISFFIAFQKAYKGLKKMEKIRNAK